MNAIEEESIRQEQEIVDRARAKPPIEAPTYRASGPLVALADALAKAQGAMANARKDSTNPHFKSRYADLASIWDAAREPLSSNGLGILQMPAIKSGTLTVTTRLQHKSGEWIESDLSTSAGQGVQAIGSAITYLRRYALAAMVGIAPDEDDGEASSGRAQYGNQFRQEERPRESTQSAAAMAPKGGNGNNAGSLSQHRLPVLIAQVESAKTRDEIGAAWKLRQGLTDKEIDELDAACRKRADQLKTAAAATMSGKPMREPGED